MRPHLILFHSMTIIIALIGGLVLWRGLTLPNTNTLFDLILNNYPYLISGIVIYYLGQSGSVFLYYRLSQSQPQKSNQRANRSRYPRFIMGQIILFEATLFIIVTLKIIEYIFATL